MAEESKYWLALKMVEGVGEVTYRNLISKFKTPHSVFKSAKKEILEVDGVGEKLFNQIRTFSDWDVVESEIAKTEKLGINLVFLNDPEYPKNLIDIYNPPPVMYKIGGFLPADDIAIAIVGTRAPDRYGRLVAEKLSEEIALRGITVVSGMARGVDSVAHRAALRVGGRTIAVLGSGIDNIYPPENRKLSREISESGAVISEFQLGTQPDAANFPKRNRIISGLSLGVVIVQAPDKSGALITASTALEQNREVFAVPGNILNRLSQGTNYLIKSGAKLVQSVDDIVEEIETLRRVAKERAEDYKLPRPELSSDEQTIYTALENESLTIDEITRLTGIVTSKALSILLALEIKGLLTQLPGKFFELRRA